MKGILLINLGTPDAPTESAVRAYLQEFLSDPYVITLPAIIRHWLLQKIILKNRPKQSAQAYQKIWTDNGSPLLVNSVAMTDKIRRTLQCDDVCIALGMRYGNPSIASAIQVLQQNHCDKMLVFPLFPQQARATTQTALDNVHTILLQNNYHPTLHIIHDFYNQNFYLRSLSEIIQRENKPDHFLLFSFHGLPRRHRDAKTYHGQCHQTAQLIAEQLQLPEDQFHIAFQSRLGLTKWIAPYTDHVIKTLRQQGIKNLSVVCPSFVVDCVETLEEINIQLRAQWMQLGGKSFHYIPCLNHHNSWVSEIARFINEKISN